MADGRMLKKVICESPRLAALKNDTHRLIYTWLIPFLDVEGRFSADPRIIKGHVAPILDHITKKIIINALNDMAVNNLIVLYAVDGKNYLELQRFKKHQNLREDREKRSDIPPPTPGVLPESSGRTPTQDKLSKDKLSKANARARGDEPVDNFSDPDINPADFNPPKVALLKPKPKKQEPDDTLPDDGDHTELRDLIGKVKTKYPRLSIDTWYASNIRAREDAILHVLRSLLKNGDGIECQEPQVLRTYLQTALNVEIGKYNAADFDREQAQKKRARPGEKIQSLGDIMSGAMGRAPP